MQGYICIHGHFYQPPRENPWLERIEVQDSASPFHDWNAKVHAECYAPNAVSRIVDGAGRITGIVNNYEYISFNFGPTLLAWIQQHDPDIYKKIIAADRISAEKHRGHGNAIAQAFNHMIMPLANRRDKVTQTIWGIRSFQKHFNRPPEGMWLPETAVDTETLEILCEQNIRFTILSPRQAKRVRPLQSAKWQDVSDGSIDTTMPYLIHLPCGDTLTVFFYHGGIAHDLAFGGLLQHAEDFENRLLQAMPASNGNPPLVHVATDGETYGHHHHFGDMSLAFVIEQIRQKPDISMTNYGEYLSLFSPTHEVEIFEHSSWSCVHGIERWRADCGCRAGGHPDWNQKWRQPLRESLDWLRYESIQIYNEQASKLLRDPWLGRDEYIDVILSHTEETKNEFLSSHASKTLNDEERSSALQLLEMQRNAMLMFTSCGWFFDEISGLEATQILRYAARTIELTERCSSRSLESLFMQRLKEAQSNIREMGNGADIYRRFVLGSKSHLKEVAIHFALSSFFVNYQQQNTIGCYTIELKNHEKRHIGSILAAAGRIHIRSTITEEEASFLFAALKEDPHDYHCTVKECSAIINPSLMGKRSEHHEEALYWELADALLNNLQSNDSEARLKSIEKNLGSERYTIKDLFKDEQEKLINTVLDGELEYVQETFEKIYQKTSFLTALLADCGHRIPSPFVIAAETTLKHKLINLLQNPNTTHESIRLLLDEITRWQINLDQDWLERSLRKYFEEEMTAVAANPAIKNISRINAKLSHLYLFPVHQINLWKTQNYYFDLLTACYPSYKIKAQHADSAAQEWVEEFKKLGKNLSINVDTVDASIELSKKEEGCSSSAGESSNIKSK